MCPKCGAFQIKLIWCGPRGWACWCTICGWYWQDKDITNEILNHDNE